MAPLTPEEIATIKHMLDTGTDLPRSFQKRLFPQQASSNQEGQRVVGFLNDAFAQQEQDEDVDVAALAQGNEIHIWRVPRLWALAESLPVQHLAVESMLHNFDNARWFDGDELPTVRAVVEHARRIMHADLAYPIIVSAEGRILDGMHRLAKASIAGLPTIAVARFAHNPEPDFRVPRS